MAPDYAMGWRTWLFLGGRGAGKTRAGAEWVRFALLFGGYRRASFVGPALNDVREVMIEGPSGVSSICHGAERPTYHVSRRRLEWPSGAAVQVFSAEDPESLRGPQFDLAWCDEAAAWRDGAAVWDTMQMGLRLGHTPRALVTTTPKPTAFLKRLVDTSGYVTRASTFDNAPHLAPDFIRHVSDVYGGTRLGRQELDGELIEDLEGVLWTREMLAASRIETAPRHMDDIVVAIDPPASSGASADACGIIAAGVQQADGAASRCFILQDASQSGLGPMDWAGRATALAAHVGASQIIAEANQGGEMVRSVLMAAGCELPVRLVHARLGKRGRAIPIAALYEQRRVFHVGVLKDLEDEMCSFGAPGFSGSPDRLDAMVWAVTQLMSGLGGPPRVRRI
ncbi:MAG: terminase family protein [Pseudomonadota bacterium]